MKLIVGPVYTEVVGSSFEMRSLEDALTVVDQYTDCMEELLTEDGLFFSGLLRLVLESLKGHGCSVEVEYEEGVSPPYRRDPIPADVVPGKTLRDYQVSAVEKALYWGRGIIRLPTRSGKTFISIAINKILDLPSLFLVHSSNLLVQTAKVYIDSGMADDTFLIGDIDSKTRKSLEEAGILFFDPEDPEECFERKHCVALINSVYFMVKRLDSSVEELLDRTELLIGDEIHHLASPMWVAVFSRCSARYRYGLSATPWVGLRFSQSIRDYTVLGLTGPVVYELPNFVLEQKGAIERPTVYMVRVRKPARGPLPSSDWPYLVEHGIIKNQDRNDLILHYSKQWYKEGDKTLIPVMQKVHLDYLLQELVSSGTLAYGSKGNREVLEYSNKKVRVSKMTPEELHYLMAITEGGFLLVCTNVYDESLDLPELNSLVFAAGGKSVRQVLQRIGRTLCPGFGGVRILDFQDEAHGVLRSHSSKRRYVYKEMGWPVEMAPPVSRNLMDLSAKAIVGRRAGRVL